MSGTDVLVEDSGSDTDLEARSARIDNIAARYQAGQDLFIMSAAIKGELERNPWARKRKRSRSRDDLSAYFAPGKVVHNSAPRPSVRGKAHPSQPISTSDERDSVSRTSAWDKEPSEFTSKLAQRSNPTARLIDFRQYDSQALQHLVPKHISQEPTDSVSKARRMQPSLSSGKLVIMDQPVLLKSSFPISSSNAADQKAPPGPTHDSVLALTESDALQLDSLQEMAPQPPIDSARMAIKVIETESRAVPSVAGHHVSSLQAVDDDVHSAEQELSPGHSPVNTQAELENARKGLAEALQFEANDDLPCVATERASELRPAGSLPSKSASNRLPSTANPANSMQTPAKHQIGEDEFLPVSDLDDVEEEVDSIPPIGGHHVKIPATPPTAVHRAPISFGQFQSPTATQATLIGFGSPLTFTPQRPARKKNAGTDRDRQDETIDDIQQYLAESNFDVDAEIRKLGQKDAS